jgi:hypothetical protein
VDIQQFSNKLAVGIFGHRVEVRSEGVSGQPAISTSLSVATHLVRYANPSSDWRYSSIELVYVAGMATMDWTESLCGRVGWAVGGDSLTSYR